MPWVPRLSERQSKARVRELEKGGWIVNEVTVAGVGTLVTKRRPEGEGLGDLGGWLVPLGCAFAAAVLLAPPRPPRPT